jgi:C_GCAxxG_C_C family probable redox protein
MKGSVMVTEISVPTDPDWPTKVRARAHHNMSNYESCTQSIVGAFMDELGIADPLVLRAAGGMHGGMVSSLTCGIVTAGMMVLGLLMGREKLEEGIDGIFPIVIPGQDLVSRLEKRFGTTSCKELSGVDFTDLNRAMQFISSGENAKCFEHVADGAEEIARFLQELSEKGELFRVGTAVTQGAPGEARTTASD